MTIKEFFEQSVAIVDNPDEFIGFHNGEFVRITSDHTHDFAAADHNHNALYAALEHVHDYTAQFAAANHDHNAIYAALNHVHDYTAQFAAANHDHNAIYAALNHVHDYTSQFAAANHDHDAVYAALNHVHDYTAQFAAANHNHDGQYAPPHTDHNTLAGHALHGGRNIEANKIVRTNGNGYLETGYINSQMGVSDYLPVVNIVYEQGDNYFRYASLDRIAAVLAEKLSVSVRYLGSNAGRWVSLGVSWRPRHLVIYADDTDDIFFWDTGIGYSLMSPGGIIGGAIDVGNGSFWLSGTTANLTSYYNVVAYR